LNKRKVYLDTSIISYLKAEDTMNETLLLWNNFMSEDNYIIYISQLTIEEISKCSEPKKSYMLDMLSKINYIKLGTTEEVYKLRNEYLKHKVLSERNKADLLHIAFAVTNNIEYIISWNFKHFVNINTIKRINVTNILLNYMTVNIVTPQMITGGVDDEKK